MAGLVVRFDPVLPRVEPRLYMGYAGLPETDFRSP